MKKYVAEVWLEWPVCRGSTMYRQRFKWLWQAHLAAKFSAIVLDLLLPTWYWSEYSNGRPYRERYDYGICYGVRPATQQEQEKFRPIWTLDMPGTREHIGEHAMSHPLKQQLDDYQV